MTSAYLDELHWLTEALRAHVDWSRSNGALGLPRCDQAMLEQRRDHYRRTPLTETIYDAQPHDDAEAPRIVSPEVLSAGRLPSEPLQKTSVLDSAPKAARSSTQPTPAAEHVASVLSAVTKPAPIKAEPARTSPSAAPPAVSVAAPPASSPLSPEQKGARLLAMHNKVNACTSCGLCKERKRPAFSRGTGSARIAFVGEGPGAEEDAQGVPFVGAAGQLLDRMIDAMGLSRDDVYVCNVIKCRPPNNRKPTDEELAACRHFVVEQLRLIEPQVIVALGGSAVEGLLGLKLGITRLRGTWRLYDGRIPLMPTFHPAYLLRTPDAKRQVWEDLQAVLVRVNRAVPRRG